MLNQVIKERNNIHHNSPNVPAIPRPNNHHNSPIVPAIPRPNNHHNSPIVPAIPRPNNDQNSPATPLVKLVDFGLAKSSRITTGNADSGTGVYFSPEMVDHVSIIDCRKSDVWALGVSFYILLTGERPFDDRYRPGKLNLDISRVNYNKKAIRDPVAMDLLEKILVRDPKMRFNIDQVLNHRYFR